MNELNESTEQLHQKWLGYNKDRPEYNSNMNTQLATLFYTVSVLLLTFS